MTPNDPTGAVADHEEFFRDADDDVIYHRLQMCVERLRNAFRSVMPEANITDREEGAQAAALIKILKERHG